MRPSDTKAEQRSEIARQVAKYLSKGGQIEELPPWATGVQVEISKRLRKSLGERVIWGKQDGQGDTDNPDSVG